MSGSEGELYRHLDGCTSCRNEADALLQLDCSLREGFQLLASSAARPPEERIEQVIQYLRAEAVEVKLLRRARRGVRLILWAAFYGFTLLAACLLAVALYRALQGN